MESRVNRTESLTSRQNFNLTEHMEFNTTTTAIVFLVLVGLVIGGTIMSPMSTSTVIMVSVGLGVFGLVTMFLGIKHGEYRSA